MAYERVEVITGEARRRQWSPEEKRRIVTEALQPGAVVSAIARRHGVCKSLVFRWRRQARAGLLEDGALAGAPRLAEVRLVAASDEATMSAAAENAAPLTRPPAVGVAARCRPGVIEIELRNGRRVRVDRHVDASALKRVLAVLDGR